MGRSFRLVLRVRLPANVPRRQGVRPGGASQGFHGGKTLQAEQLELQDQILQALQSKRANRVKELWGEVAPAEDLPAIFHKPVIEKMARKQDRHEFEDLYEQVFELLAAAERHDEVIELSEYLLASDWEPGWLRGMLVNAVRAAYAEGASEKIGDLVERSGLNDERTPLKKAWFVFSDLLGATKGQVFFHRSWGLGVVRDLDIDSGRVVVDFASRRGQQMTLDGVRQFLVRVPRDHIRAYIALEPEELREQMKSRPAEVVKLALRSFNGRMKVAELKRLLTDRFLKEAEFRSFWNAAKKGIKLDPWIDANGTNANAELALRDNPRSFLDAAFAQLLQAQTVRARREVLRDIRRHGSDAEMNEQDVEALHQLMCKPVSDGAVTTDAEKLNHGLLFAEFEDLFPGRENPCPVDELLSGEDPVPLVEGLEVADLRRLALEKIRVLQPEHWHEYFAESILALDPRTAAWMERELLNNGFEHDWHVALERILAKPHANPDLFVWAAKNLLDGQWQHLDDSIPPIMVFEELLSLLSELEDPAASADGAEAGSARSSSAKIRAVLSDQNGKRFRKAVISANVEEARRVLLMIRLHNSLSNQLKQTLEMIVIHNHEQLRGVGRAEEEQARSAPKHHRTTKSALAAKRAELSRLTSEEIPATSVRIEEAREHGDLRENSEYHAAKERLGQLQQAASELEELIARARLVEPGDVSTETSGFGTRLRLRNTATGEERNLTILGMWESDPNNNIISDQTHVGKQMVGRKAGDVFAVTLPDQSTAEYELLEIQNALKEAVSPS